MDKIRTVLLSSVSVAVIVTVLLILATTLWAVWFNDPPIRLRSLDPVTLGVLCPGEQVPVGLHIDINEAIILHYYVSVMDATGTKNIIGTARAFTDNLHPRPASFDEGFPWIVPTILPGRYRRVVAARNVAGTQKTVFVEQFFEIPEDCPEREGPPH